MMEKVHDYCAVNLIKIELSAVVKLIISMTHHYKSCYYCNKLSHYGVEVPPGY